jgi:hypothetical protein
MKAKLLYREMCIGAQEEEAFAAGRCAEKKCSTIKVQVIFLRFHVFLAICDLNMY